MDNIELSVDRVEEHKAFVIIALEDVFVNFEACYCCGKTAHGSSKPASTYICMFWTLVDISIRFESGLDSALYPYFYHLVVYAILLEHLITSA